MDVDSKKAVVVGGSNGIGLAITKSFIEKEYTVIIIDKFEPNKESLTGEYIFIQSDLLDFEQELFEKLALDKKIEVLMITAGIGRVADFEYLHTAEIEKILTINTVSTLKIIRLFYKRIKSNENFYCGIMGSIAGLVSSPMFSVYAASKAAIYRFIESVNIELNSFGTKNRILNVSPGSIKGTCFNGGENNLLLTEKLAEQIVKSLLMSNELFIPEYDEVYKRVLERYQTDAEKYGLESYQYKKDSGRAINESKVCIGYLSGTFDLFHIGHLNLLQRAKKECDYLIVGVHPDASHKGKKTFISFEERIKIVAGCKYVDKVVPACKEDSDAWDIWHYNRLFVGSDYKGTERFNRYESYFQNKNVEIIYFPYTQGTCSTQIRGIITEENDKKIKR